MKVRFTSAAQRELTQAVKFYEAAENGLGARFLDEVESTVQRIVDHPAAWKAMSRKTRRCRTHRFPYGMFYEIKADEILILSVMDLRREPRSWENY